MLKAVGKHGLAALQNEKPHSAVSAWIDTLCLPKYEEDDYEGITELVESINLQTTGPTEASRAIRKKLKYSNTHGQLRALTIIKALVENCGHGFQITFANERLVDRIKLMAGDPQTDPAVKRKIMSVLGSWHRQFKDDPTMQLVAGLYGSCGGGTRRAPDKTAATEAYEQQQARYEREAAERAERKMKDRSDKEQAKERIAKEKEEREKAKRKGNKVKRPPFNFEAEKPRIMSTVGEATQAAQNLINALQRVNRETESITENPRVVDCLAKAKTDRKIVVRYIQLVDNDIEGDFIGTLLSTNEQVLAALALYDRMSKPIELDSDDEHVEEARSAAKQQGLRVPEPDGDTASIRSRLSAFDWQDTEVDKLQERQRSRVEKANRARAAQSVHPDLQDLAFGPTAGRRVPFYSFRLPRLPPHSSTNPALDETFSRGSLSEYSDSDAYSSSGEDYPSHRGAPPTSSTAGDSHPSANARSYARYVRQDDEREGKGKGLLEEGGEDDPFADPFDDREEEEVGTPGIMRKRMDWREL